MGKELTFSCVGNYPHPLTRLNAGKNFPPPRERGKGVRASVLFSTMAACEASQNKNGVQPQSEAGRRVADGVGGHDVELHRGTAGPAGDLRFAIFHGGRQHGAGSTPTICLRTL